MTKFSIKDCHICWWKQAEISDDDKQAVISDLRKSSEIIEEAMNYTRKREKQNAIVRFSIGQESDKDFSLQVYSSGTDGWSVAIFLTDYSESVANPSEQMVAEIVSERWQIILILDEEDYNPSQEI